MYHVYQTLVHISNEHKDKLRDLYDYKLEDFNFYGRENLMEPYQAVWKKYQQALILFPLQKHRESPTLLHHLHSRQPYNRGENEEMDRRHWIYQLSKPWDSWSVDTHAGYLHSLNLGNSQQPLNLSAFRYDRPETLPAHAQHGRFISNNPMALVLIQQLPGLLNLSSNVQGSHYENVLQQNSTQYITPGTGPYSMTLPKHAPSHAENSSSLLVSNPKTVSSLQNGDVLDEGTVVNR